LLGTQQSLQIASEIKNHIVRFLLGKRKKRKTNTSEKSMPNNRATKLHEESFQRYNDGLLP
jgi:hypothetical protein